MDVAKGMGDTEGIVEHEPEPNDGHQGSEAYDLEALGAACIVEAVSRHEPEAHCGDQQLPDASTH